jgi:thiamine-monophosphate kinase
MTDLLEKAPTRFLPIGDDVSALELDQDRLAVVKSDTLVGKTDVPPGMSLWQAARKAVVINVSDFAAKGVQPLAILASLAFPPHLRKEDLEQIARGLGAGAAEYGAYVIGGDTNETAVDLVITCSLFGICRKDELIKRSGAKPGDLVAVTGTFGEVSAGLKILLENLDAPARLKEKLLAPVYMPNARLREGLALAETGLVTASIDSSDGLAWSLYELSEASGVGFSLTSLPTSSEVQEFARMHGLDVHELALYGGEEFELVVTVNPEGWSQVRRAVEKAGGSILQIGRVVEEREMTLKVGKELIMLEPKGFQHFSQAP